MIRRRFLLQTLGLLWSPPRGFASRSDVSVEVLQLLHPRLLILSAAANHRLRVSSAGRSQTVECRGTLRIDSCLTPLEMSAAGGGPAHFVLSIPGVIRRRYFGTLSIAAGESDLLEPVVRMPVETAVSSVVGAELPAAAASPDSLCAQAVVARSFLQASARRHQHADFCDTTHCQYLRSPAPPGSKVAHAADQTSGLVLSTGALPFAALYSAACGGFTEPATKNGFLYQRVDCETCRRSRISRRGHGFGLCQVGAMDLARRGWNWQQILAKYYPGAALVRA